MDRSFPLTEWKPEASAGKHSQVSLSIMSLVPGAQLLDVHVLQRVTFNGCLNEAVRHSGKEDQEIAAEIHISAGYMSRFLRGVGQQWARRMVAFMYATNSIAPLQWMAEQMGCEITVRNDARREADLLRARLQELERYERIAAA